MMPEDRKPNAGSSLGPFLVLAASVLFTGVMVMTFVVDLRFVFTGVQTQATIARKWRDAGDARPSFELAFLDDQGREHILRDEPGTADRFAEGEAVAIRYLESDPSRVRREEDVHPAWRWSAVWVMLGMALTAFGVLLTWGRRPNQRRYWGRGRPGER